MFNLGEDNMKFKIANGDITVPAIPPSICSFILFTTPDLILTAQFGLFGPSFVLFMS